MAPFELTVFMAVAALAGFVQAFTGFALGIILVGGAAVLGLAPVSFSAAVVSIISLPQALWILRTRRREVSLSVVGLMAGGVLLGTWLGVEILDRMSGREALLQQVMGCFIVIASAALAVRSRPAARPSGAAMNVAVGLGGGLTGGLFGTAGPPIALHLYRQPLEPPTIRSTLLALFVVAGSARTAVVFAQGGLDGTTLGISAACLPLILVTGKLGASLTQRVAPTLIRRLVFSLLVAEGVAMIASAAA